MKAIASSRLSVWTTWIVVAALCSSSGQQASFASWAFVDGAFSSYSRKMAGATSQFDAHRHFLDRPRPRGTTHTPNRRFTSTVAFRGLKMSKQHDEDDRANVVQEQQRPNSRDDDNAAAPFDLDAFLDTPFFDPQEILNDDNQLARSKDKNVSWKRRLALLVQDDYETVELVVAGVLAIVCIVVAQEMLRIQFYGWDNYVPFAKGVRPGQLF